MKISTVLLLLAIALLMAVTSLWMGQQAYSWLPSQATAEAKLVDDLFSILVTIATFIFLGVISILLFTILTRRAARGDLSDGPPIEGNPKLETLWIATPILLVVWIAAHSFHVYQQMGVSGPMQVAHQHLLPGIEPASAATLNGDHERSQTVEVFVRQWAWSFRYPEEHITSTELHLPLNRRVHLAMQSADVLHGFYVADFRLKQDVIPGRTVNLQFTPIRAGRYQLHDSQFSGTYFAAMQADVYIDSPEEYDQWIAQAAAREPTPASNQAASEHRQQPEKVITSGWQSIPPAAPPVVNHPN